MNMRHLNNDKLMNFVAFFQDKRVEDLITFSGEKAKVTRALAPKLTSIATLIPLPLRRKGKTSDIISQPIGPKDICKNTMKCEVR